MMKQTYEQVMKWVALSEGGYVNHPKDPGGATNHGVTQRVYNAYRARKGRSKRGVQLINDKEVSDIYQTQYAKLIQYDELPAGVDYALLDYAINSGTRRAVKAVQRLVGVKRDGVFGNITLAAISNYPSEALIINLCEQRLAFMKRLRIWRYFKNGWTSRVMGKYNGVQTHDIGVIDRAVMLSRKLENIPAPTISTVKAQGRQTISGRFKSLFDFKGGEHVTISGTF